MPPRVKISYKAGNFSLLFRVYRTEGHFKIPAYMRRMSHEKEERKVGRPAAGGMYGPGPGRLRQKGRRVPAAQRYSLCSPVHGLRPGGRPVCQPGLLRRPVYLFLRRHPGRGEGGDLDRPGDRRDGGIYILRLHHHPLPGGPLQRQRGPAGKLPAAAAWQRR